MTYQEQQAKVESARNRLPEGWRLAARRVPSYGRLLLTLYNAAGEQVGQYFDPDMAVKDAHHPPETESYSDWPVQYGRAVAT